MMTEQTTKRAQTTTDYERLVRFLISPGPTFGFAIARYADPRVRNRLIEQATRDAQTAGLRAETLNLSRTKLEGHPNLTDLLEQRLRPKKNEEATRAVFIVQLEKFLIDPFGEARVSPSISVLNQSRDLLPRRIGARVVLWLTDAAANTFATFAHDLYDVALTHFRFEDRDDPMPITQYGRDIPQWLMAASDEDKPRLQRETSLLETVFRSATSAQTKADAAFRIAQIYAILSQHTEAIVWFEVALALYHSVNNTTGEANTHLRYGDFLFTWGKLEKALKHFEAAVLIYEISNNKRTINVVKTKITDIFYQQGKLNEAFDILQNQILPIDKLLANPRETALTHGRIADILQARGQLDEALKIYQDQVLPIFQEISDLQSEAATRGKIAAILEARGQIEEALDIQQKMVLPSYKKLRDKYSILFGETNIANLLHQRGRPEDKPEIVSLLNSALQAAREMQIPEATQIEDLMRQIGLTPESL